MSRLSRAHGTSFRGNCVQPAEYVPPFIARILSQERFFRDSPPTWSGAPTAREAKEARERFVKRLRRFSIQCPDAQQLAEALSNCERPCRCKSGACPECGRAFQRWFVAQVENFVGTSKRRGGEMRQRRLRRSTHRGRQFDGSPGSWSQAVSFRGCCKNRRVELDRGRNRSEPQRRPSKEARHCLATANLRPCTRGPEYRGDGSS
jgi:hypothetical protein